MGQDVLIEVTGVSKSYEGRPVLRDVSFGVPRGTTLTIMGGSGVGKTTLLRVLIGATRPDAGCVLIDGADIAHLGGRALDRARRRFGVLFQDAALLNSMTIAENVGLPILYHGAGLNDEEIDIIVTMKLQQVGLLERKHALPEEVSGGQRKRAGLARALALDPLALFYDEPTSGLDPVATAEIDDLINDLKTKMGMTSVVVTHNVTSAFRISDQIVILDEGRIIEQGTPEQIQASSNEKVRQFIEGRSDGPIRMRGSHDQFLRDLLQL
jgi:phospholipid/cholesterol/gamma-HCH transport system ATP-binding protein